MSTTPEVFPVFTKKWHSKPYEALSVTRPEVSAKGKNIIITGGGSGIGAATAIAFAKAGAKSVGIVGRREGKLVESKNAIEALGLGTKVEYAVADIASATEVPAAFAKFKTAFGPIDILISNAGYLNAPAPVITTDADDWWTAFEINVKGLFISARAFFAVASETPTLLYTSTVLSTLAAMPGASAYAASKIAGSRVIEYLAAENPKLFTLNIHPGVVETELSTKGGVPHMDDVELPAAFYVWAASPEAKFLNGKFAWVNWDVEELKARAAEISGSSVLTLTLDGPKYGA